MNIKIVGTGSALPKKRVTNEDLSEIVDTSDEWIKSRTGIETRHLAVEETTTSLSVEAAQKALKRAGMCGEDIDLIIAATVTPDKRLPNLSCEVQSALGAERAVAFDLSAACSGFLFSLHTAAMYLENGVYENALIIGAETLSKLIDWKDRSTCVLFGDGAGVAVVRAEKGEDAAQQAAVSANAEAGKTEMTAQSRGVLAMEMGSDGAQGMVLTCPDRPVNNPYVKNAAARMYISMNGQDVYKFAVRTVPETIRRVVKKAGLELEDIDYFLLHQANYRIIEAVAKRLHQPMEKFPTNLKECGNISAASVPILLDKVNNHGMIGTGSKIVLAGFGAGLTWGATVLEW